MTVTLRPIRDGDALQLLALEQALARDGRGMVKSAEDLPSHPTNITGNVTEWLALPPWRGVRFVQEDNHGAIIGEGSLKRFGPSMLEHTVLLALGIHPSAQGQGLGRAMMTALLAWAADPPAHPDGLARPISRVELYTRADNVRAVALYESLGFAQEGRRVGFVRLPDGQFIDDLILTLRLPSADGQA